MDVNEIRQQWFAHFAAVLNDGDLRVVREDRDHTWYVCPCGGNDHAASRSWYSNGHSMELSPVLNCYVTNQQWLVRLPDVAGIIQQEEKKYIDLLNRAGPIITKITKRRGKSEETKVFLFDTHGIPADVVDDFWIDNP